MKTKPALTLQELYNKLDKIIYCDTQGYPLPRLQVVLEGDYRTFEVADIATGKNTVVLVISPVSP